VTSRQKVTFAAEGAALTGNLFLPDGAEGPVPAVVVAGTWTSVKELMADRYAERLADRGYAALSRSAVRERAPAQPAPDGI
jgi:dienelactone hydrolase